jgi:hypothetical protein
MIRFALIAVWAVFTLCALWYVAVFGLNAPTADEWEFVPVLVGQEHVGPWLWAQHNEHRLPLPRLIFVTLFGLTHDFRAGMILQVVMLSVLALGAMQLSAKFRGRPDWPDAFFPVSLLHTGHWENFLLGYQICFVLFAVFVTALVVTALRTTRETAFRSGVEAGILLLLAVMTGGCGLVLVAPVGLWLVYLAVVVWQTDSKGRALTLLGLVALSVAYLVLYFVSYEKPPGHMVSTDPVAIAKVAGQVLAMAFGPGVSGVWRMVFAAGLILGVATVVLLVRRRSEKNEWPAALGVLAVVAGVVGVAVVIGVGRAAMGDDRGLWSRYSMLSWPLLAAVYLSWVKYGPGTADGGLRKWVPAVLCLAASAAFLPNTGTGMLIGAAARARNIEMETDARAGMPADQFVEKHFPNTYDTGQDERAKRYIPLLREAHIGIFASDETRRGFSPWWLLLVGLIVALLLRWFWHLGKAVQAERARELFRLQHERFEEQLLKAAAASGVPRGLKWTKCTITGEALLVRDVPSGGIVALVPVVIEFEPEEGSDMVDNPNAREPRHATAVFTFHRGTWETAGRVVMNHTPEQTVKAFATQFRVIHHGHH